MPTTTTLAEMLGTLLKRRPGRGRAEDRRPLPELCRALLSDMDEPARLRCAAAILARYQGLDGAGRLEFFSHVDREFDIDAAGLAELAGRYAADPSAQAYAALIRAADTPRRRFFRRLNEAPGATAELVRMRADLIGLLPRHPELARTDIDLADLLRGWFNRGFLVLRRITWDSPASLLEKIIAYEAVHEIRSWDDLRRRLNPADRRLFAFFHPAMPDEPLIFVEVALTRGVPGSIDALLTEAPAGEAEDADTAVFYAISNCQPGLKGVSFGNFLIKQVAEELGKELPGLRNFVTLSPVPGLVAWLEARGLKALAEQDEEALRRLAAHYLLVERDQRGRPLDPVARFHLGNGASVDGLHLNADTSESGLARSLGVMVNYRYEPDRIAENLALLARGQEVAAVGALRSLARQAEKLIPARPAITAESGAEAPQG
ncbi:MAG: decarboxylase [Alphaproteobacteria bacterium]|nr:MAG: decarboxylase [Alphaproteobacteria bacterium]